MTEIRSALDLTTTLEIIDRHEASVKAVLANPAASQEELRAAAHDAYDLTEQLIIVHEYFESTRFNAPFSLQGSDLTPEQRTRMFDLLTTRTLMDWAFNAQDELKIRLRLPVEGFTTWGNLADRLTALRKQAGKTQAEIGAALTPPIGKSAVAHIENGRNRPSIEQLTQWAEACGFEVDLKLRPKGPRPLSDRIAGLAGSLDEKDQRKVALVALMYRDGDAVWRGLLTDLLRAMETRIIQYPVDPEVMEYDGNPATMVRQRIG